MLFNKYQYRPTDLKKRGYSQSCVATDIASKAYWVKWILGIEKTDIKAKLLADKLRHLQKARHVALPNILEYGFDEEQQAFAIVYEYLEGVETMETEVVKLKNQSSSIIYKTSKAAKQLKNFLL